MMCMRKIVENDIVDGLWSELLWNRLRELLCIRIDGWIENE